MRVCNPPVKGIGMVCNCNKIICIRYTQSKLQWYAEKNKKPNVFGKMESAEGCRQEWKFMFYFYY